MLNVYFELEIHYIVRPKKLRTRVGVFGVEKFVMVNVFFRIGLGLYPIFHALIL